jgi:hypothetical protein
MRVLRSLYGFLFLCAAAANAQPPSPIAGAWTLNRSGSEMPREIGFNLTGPPPADSRGGGGTDSGGGGRRRGSGRGGGSPASPLGRMESYEESRRIQLLTAEARNPPARLIIVDTPGAVTMTNDLGQSRVLHPNVKDESIQVEGVQLIANTRRDGDRLIADYYVADGRDVRYTYSRAADSAQLVVEVEFRQRGSSDKARRVYDSGIATETAAPAPTAPSGKPATPPATPATSGSPAQAADAFDSRPGAELRGLKTLGILVEDISGQAAACGLNHDAIETALVKRLADGGFTVRRNSDDDTYVYVNVMTTTLSTGTCVTRYDAFLYTHATANLTYRERPVLVQVSLMHRGGMGASAPVSHAASVTRGLEEYVGLFVSQIRAANQ